MNTDTLQLVEFQKNFCTKELNANKKELCESLRKVSTEFITLAHHIENGGKVPENLSAYIYTPEYHMKRIKHSEHNLEPIISLYGILKGE